MFPAVVMSMSMSNNSTICLSEEDSSTTAHVSSNNVQELVRSSLNPMISPPPQLPHKIKKKRNLPGNPDPDAEVIALSPKTLMATNRFVCEICNKGFQRDQNLQLHRRGHNLPWKLKQRSNKEMNRKRAYVCPEPTCVHHHPSRALGDLTGIKKHFCRKHGEKKWKCDKCSKIYAVQSDWKAHSKICGTREYRCDCGTLFSRKDSFITHRAFCDALAEESARLISSNQFGTTPLGLDPQPLALLPHAPQPTFHLNPPLFSTQPQPHPHPRPHHYFPNTHQNNNLSPNPWEQQHIQNPNPNPNAALINPPLHIKPETLHLPIQPPPPLCSSSPFFQPPAHLSATALLQKAAVFGAHPIGQVSSAVVSSDMSSGTGMTPELMGFRPENFGTWQRRDHLTRDFLGLTRDQCGGNGGGGGNGANVNVTHLLTFTGGVSYEGDHTLALVKAHGGFGFAAEAPSPSPQSLSETWGNC